ncbi:MAG: cation-translocating P-type ATPase [Candidatus Accumulibacter sp.]|jgi:Cd2+/Zn2+-exporting ATPase|nr:cation-translocating P-type ATPase [Accumulibacter sp.]
MTSSPSPSPCCSCCCAADNAAAPVAAPPEKWWPLVLAILLALSAEFVGETALPRAEWIAPLLALSGIALSGTEVYARGWRSLLAGRLDINTLMALAVTGAFLLRQWPEAAMVMALFTLAERLEGMAVARTRNAIGKLLEMAPETASVLRDGEWQSRAAKEVRPGETVRVRPGERIPLDGEVVRGQSAVNQSAITGESLPVEKAAGDAVFAGTLNETGLFEFRVTAAAQRTLLARIVQLVAEAEGARAPTQRFIDRFARYYTPLIFAAAVVAAIAPPLLYDAAWRDCVYRALVLLVIACPCAFVISTPVAIVSGLARAARMGILIKGGVHLETGRKLTRIAFDKTGTLTHGKPECTDCEVFAPERERAGILQYAFSLASCSDHPVSRALTREPRLKAFACRELTAFAALPGSGIRGVIGGLPLTLGNRRTIASLQTSTPEALACADALEGQGKTVVFLSDARRILALFAVTDTPRLESREVVAELKGMGITSVMFTGDNDRTAQAIAATVGIDVVASELLPEDKYRKIAELKTPRIADKKEFVGMIGDGINDAPALAAADMGFAMGVMGTDAALEAADVALMDDDLRKIPKFVRLSKATHAVLAQNIAVALAIKGIFFVLALSGIVSMWIAVIADLGSTLLVVANSLRLLRHGAEPGKPLEK